MSLLHDLRALCDKCLSAPQNHVENADELTPACRQCNIRHNAADEIERLHRELIGAEGSMRDAAEFLASVTIPNNEGTATVVCLNLQCGANSAMLAAARHKGKAND